MTDDGCRIANKGRMLSTSPPDMVDLSALYPHQRKGVVGQETNNQLGKSIFPLLFKERVWVRFINNKKTSGRNPDVTLPHPNPYLF